MMMMMMIDLDDDNDGYHYDEDDFHQLFGVVQKNDDDDDANDICFLYSTTILSCIKYNEKNHVYCLINRTNMGKLLS